MSRLFLITLLACPIAACSFSADAKFVIHPGVFLNHFDLFSLELIFCWLTQLCRLLCPFDMIRDWWLVRIATFTLRHLIFHSLTHANWLQRKWKCANSSAVSLTLSTCSLLTIQFLSFFIRVDATFDCSRLDCCVAIKWFSMPQVLYIADQFVAKIQPK